MSRNRPAKNIELHINELVLHGFPRGEQHRIGESVRQELLRQLSEQGVPDALTRQGNVSRLNAGSIRAGQGSKPETIGRQVAQVVYGSVAGDRQLGHGGRHTGVAHNTQIKNGGSTKS